LRMWVWVLQEPAGVKYVTQRIGLHRRRCMLYTSD
jgi:hypothetical protein